MGITNVNDSRFKKHFGNHVIIITSDQFHLWWRNNPRFSLGCLFISHIVFFSSHNISSVFMFIFVFSISLSPRYPFGLNVWKIVSSFQKARMRETRRVFRLWVRSKILWYMPTSINRNLETIIGPHHLSYDNYKAYIVKLERFVETHGSSCCCFMLY